jgi:hypothetical protein
MAGSDLGLPYQRLLFTSQSGGAGEYEGMAQCAGFKIFSGMTRSTPLPHGVCKPELQGTNCSDRVGGKPNP